MNFELHHNCSTGIKFFTDNSQVCFFFMVDLKDVKITKSSDFNTKKKTDAFTPVLNSILKINYLQIVSSVILRILRTSSNVGASA